MSSNLLRHDTTQVIRSENQVNSISQVQPHSQS